jgi:LytS/YehU family sensor histidine kinase
LLTIRFQRKLQITFAISDEEARKYRIVPMTLQLLIENAVKHNQMSDKAPLQIHIGIDLGQLWVSNSLHARLRRSEAGGTGLQNIIARYHLLTKQFIQIEDSDTIFRVNVPLLTE